MTNTSWQNVSHWYDQSVGTSGHYYHQHVVLPNTLRLLGLNSKSSLLDLACGSGVLERAIPKSTTYIGLDSSPALISSAKKQSRSPNHTFLIHDISQPFPINQSFTHSSIILALQNLEKPNLVFTHLSRSLATEGILVLVLNHPFFRIPRQSAWEIDPNTKIQYRKINRYLSPLKIPINLGQQITWSFHFPLSTYSKYLHDSGFVIELIEEWISDKHSVGKFAKSENLSRSEFPLFMAIKAFKR
jgi:ubiquinone/menaquinone biosynthesis C-methylase UbiE